MSNTVYPGAIDSFYNPTTGDTLATMVHHTQHGGANDAVTALETKLGTGASTASSGMFLVGTGTNATAWVSTLTSPSITTSLLDANNKTWIAANPAGSSAVNYANIGNSATGNAVTYGVGGSDTNISNNLTSKGSGKVQDNGSNLIDFRSSFANFIQTGGVWTIGSGLTASMSAATIWINGVEYSVSSISSHTFGSSVDTYVDYTVGSGITYTAVSNNAASPSLATNSVRIAIVVSGGSISSINQGSPQATAPVASNVIYSVSDSLGNIIYPNTPYPKLIGYRQTTNNFTTTSTTAVQITGLSLPILAGGTRLKVVATASDMFSNGGAAYVAMTLWNGTVGSGTQIGRAQMNPSSSGQSPVSCFAYLMPAAGLVTFNVGLQTSNASFSGEIEASSTYPATFAVEVE